MKYKFLKFLGKTRFGTYQRQSCSYDYDKESYLTLIETTDKKGNIQDVIAVYGVENDRELYEQLFYMGKTGYGLNEV